MKVTINGKPENLESVETVADLLQELGLDRRRVVVELNEKIIRRDEVDSFPVRENDRVEILRFVGGG